MKRRTFLEKAATITSASLLPLNFIKDQPKRMKNIGIQLFSLPKLLETNFRSSVEMLAQMGYQELEFYGPSPRG